MHDFFLNDALIKQEYFTILLNTNPYLNQGEKNQISFRVIKLMLSRKAAKIDEIFTVDLTAFLENMNFNSNLEFKNILISEALYLPFFPCFVFIQCNFRFFTISKLFSYCRIDVKGHVASQSQLVDLDLIQK